jgi:hypothetical protein
MHGYRAAVGVDLHPHDDGVGAVAAVVGGVDAVHVDELQPKVEPVSSISATHHAQEKLAISRQPAHHGFAHVPEMLVAGDIGNGLPFVVRALDGGAGQAVGLARGVFDADLQAHAARADDVVLDHADELFGVVVVVAQLAAA